MSPLPKGGTAHWQDPLGLGFPPWEKWESNDWALGFPSGEERCTRGSLISCLTRNTECVSTAEWWEGRDQEVTRTHSNQGFKLKWLQIQLTSWGLHQEACLSATWAVMPTDTPVWPKAWLLLCVLHSLALPFMSAPWACPREDTRTWAFQGMTLGRTKGSLSAPGLALRAPEKPYNRKNSP